MQTNKATITERLCRRYPQLRLPVCEGESQTEAYRRAVRRGQSEGTPGLRGAPEDRLELCDTPAGPAEVLIFGERRDFEHFLQVILHRCEPVEILPSVGASTIFGLTNWEKITAHQREYLLAGKTDWSTEFRRFTAEKSNYTDTLIVLSSGEYSAVPAEEIGMTPEQWRSDSLTIRKYHELAHFVCRRFFPEDIEPIRDEILADMTGLVAAFGRYDAQAALLFLGLEGSSYRSGGRLEHYSDPAAAEKSAREWIKRVRDAAEAADTEKTDPFALLLKLMRSEEKRG